MSVLDVSAYGVPFLGILAVLVVIVIGCLARDPLRQMWLHRKQQQIRERQRQQFWGYE